MISNDQWKQLSYLAPSDFSRPDKLDWSVVWGLDRLAVMLGQKPTVLDDWRAPGSSVVQDSQHLIGRAIDFTYPALDSISVLDAIQRSKLFSGYGIYQNERGYVSYHVDTRTTRSVDAPATWGGIISVVNGAKQIAYVAMSTVVDLVKKKSVLLLVLLAGGLLVWLLSRSRRQLV